MFVPKFWKLSHGTDYFTFADMVKSISEKLVFIHKDTQGLGTSRETQGKLFIDAPIGDYFYLTHGNQGIYLFGQFTGPANIFTEWGSGWIDRPFRLIRSAKVGAPYDDDKKWWSPNFRSTFASVPSDEHELFEEKILRPFFDIQLSDFEL
ncbi:hypothetical protein HUE56_05230 (plasmid) [Azospirillum oryzae]|uniref:Uncharacterized protein n=1 Tax=Azospirillum oryzae TaxID=286727 RepID=A0A6N1AEI2_9PROT|nr:hypothetical protein [Azospirillum oryzae]KAA0588580.1 hypothetical protein FZ938_11955 [Azospirillum oryzae]QKS49930.1 hypothetical protein HUE56_05230 [Azospirillum oryzae]GLR82772.1 hypothetical protein GCM10007856_54740 [Azospirillum oryzae]